MCGIAGIIRFDDKPVKVQTLNGLTEAISHRGYDNIGHCVGEIELGHKSIGLGHRRLSILDLKERSSQPMFCKERKFCIVYNGELYNFKKLRNELQKLGLNFKTSSDTEVVLEAYKIWGINCLQKFNGMFSFAIWDLTKKELFCARDSIGIKPFYYYFDDNMFCFSSESRSLYPYSKQLNQNAVLTYFFSMYVSGQQSIFKNIFKLEQGHFIKIDLSKKFIKKKWFDLNDKFSNTNDIVNLEEKVKNLIYDSVKMQLQSDVPVGALLSGGFDSSLIVRMSSKYLKNLNTYSIGYENIHNKELEIAENFAKQLGLNHRSFILEDNLIIDILDNALETMSEPVADSTIVPSWYLIKKASEDGIKVLLTGTGGDEIFGGYTRYVSNSFKRKILYMFPKYFRHIIGKILLPNNLLKSRFINSSIDMSVHTGGSPNISKLLLGGNENFENFLNFLANDNFPKEEKYLSQLYTNMKFDLSIYLPDLLLFTLDQLSMAHTVEARVPFLDNDLISKCLSIPHHFHADIKSMKTKKLLKKIARGYVSDETYKLPKSGFSGPINNWINNNEEVFRKRTIQLNDIEIFDKLDVKSWWKIDRNKRNSQWFHEIFLMYCFSTWYQKNVL